MRALVGRRIEVVGHTAIAVGGPDQRILLRRPVTAERNQLLESRARVAAAGGDAQRQREKSSLVRPSSKCSTSNAPPRWMTVSKIAGEDL